MTEYVKNNTLAVCMTSRCNLSCPHCLRKFFNKNNKIAKDLPVEIFEEILKKIKKFGFDTVSLTGGEPILHPKFKKFIELCDSYRHNFTIVTNGYLYEKYWEYFRNYLNRLSFISISLDGACPETHDRQRNHPGSFGDVINAIKFYKSKGIEKIGVVACLTNHNKDEIEAIVDLCKNLGVRRIKFLQAVSLNDGDGYYLSALETRKIVEKIEKIAKKYASKIIIKVGSHQHLIRPFSSIYCGVFNEPHFSIDYEGGLIFCCDIYKLPKQRPNILSDGFENSLEISLKLIEEMKSIRRNDLIRGGFVREEFYNCEYCNNHIEEVVSKIRKIK